MDRTGLVLSRFLALILVILFLGGFVNGKVSKAQDTPPAPLTGETEVTGAEEATAEATEEAVEETEEEEELTVATLLGDVDTLWTCLAAFLVFFMQAGFAMVEAGFTRAKNACNIIMKNVMDFSTGTVIFWLVGFGIMFGTTASSKGFFGMSNFLYDAGEDSFNWAFLIFQTVFCATAATIISGAMAERTKFASYLLYTMAITAIVYPIFGCWAWNSLLSDGGWLEGMGFHDFAGSTVVHSIGGWAALAGAIVLGPRFGKYTKNGVNLIPGHNITLAALGVFILWLGWFGFNPGSTTAVGGGSFAKIAVTTNMSAACGSISAMIVSWLWFKRPDPSFTLNGALAGLVAITAGCDVMSVPFSALTGLVAGAVVVFSCVLIDRIKIDDPVGAVSVHGVCGLWGTAAVGLFGYASLSVQLLGCAVAFAWAFGVSFLIFKTIDLTIGLRVSVEEEMEGLDITEHGMYAYPVGTIESARGAVEAAGAASLAQEQA